MTIREQGEQSLTVTYLQLLTWVRRWMPESKATTIAAGAMTHMCRSGMLGFRTPYGPYRLVYQLAEFEMRWWGQVNAYDVPFGVWRTIPVPVPELVCELARTYATMHQAVELAQLSLPDQDTMLKALGNGRFNPLGQWAPRLGDPDVPVAVTLLDRAVTALEDHECNEYDGCAEFYHLWRHEDRASARWLQGYRPHARENVHGY